MEKSCLSRLCNIVTSGDDIVVIACEETIEKLRHFLSIE